MKSPEGIAIDFVARNMFFTDSEMDSLMVAKLDGTDVKTLVSTEMANPRAVVLDISRACVPLHWSSLVILRDKDACERTRILAKPLPTLPKSLQALSNYVRSSQKSFSKSIYLHFETASM